jgi:hypothetical protein
MRVLGGRDRARQVREEEREKERETERERERGEKVNQ